MGIPNFQIIQFPEIRKGFKVHTISGYLTQVYKGSWVEGVNDKLHVCHSCELLFEDGEGRQVELQILSVDEIMARPNRVYTFEYLERETDNGTFYELVDYFFDRPEKFKTEMKIEEPEFFPEQKMCEP